MGALIRKQFGQRQTHSLRENVADYKSGDQGNMSALQGRPKVPANHVKPGQTLGTD